MFLIKHLLQMNIIHDSICPRKLLLSTNLLALKVVDFAAPPISSTLEGVQVHWLPPEVVICFHQSIINRSLRSPLAMIVTPKATFTRWQFAPGKCFFITRTKDIAHRSEDCF